MKPFVSWLPAGVLAFGALYVVGLDLQQTLPLRASLDQAVSVNLADFKGTNARLSDEEVKAVAVTNYLYRTYEPKVAKAAPGFTVYVGYYDRQLQGRTIHSPKNCLPGAGWTTLSARTVPIALASGMVLVNEYVIQKDSEQALVYYWYQGRGRVEANEYVVKWNLLRDAALQHRSEEALVRVMVPLQAGQSQAAASAVAARAVSELVAQVFSALPS
jgi:EpsI family protein